MNTLDSLHKYVEEIIEKQIHDKDLKVILYVENNNGEGISHICQGITPTGLINMADELCKQIDMVDHLENKN